LAAAAEGEATAAREKNPSDWYANPDQVAHHLVPGVIRVEGEVHGGRCSMVTGGGISGRGPTQYCLYRFNCELQGKIVLLENKRKAKLCSQHVMWQS
jgi:hypothetical protein